MKRMNLKKLLETLENARQGYSSLVFIAKKYDDKIMEMSCKAHHKMLNKRIVELGGQSVDAP